MRERWIYNTYLKESESIELWVCTDFGCTQLKKETPKSLTLLVQPLLEGVLLLQWSNDGFQTSTGLRRIPDKEPMITYQIYFHTIFKEPKINNSGSNNSSRKTSLQIWAPLKALNKELTRCIFSNWCIICNDNKSTGKA